MFSKGDDLLDDLCDVIVKIYRDTLDENTFTVYVEYQMDDIVQTFGKFRVDNGYIVNI